MLQGVSRMILWQNSMLERQMSKPGEKEGTLPDRHQPWMSTHSSNHTIDLRSRVPRRTNMHHNNNSRSNSNRDTEDISSLQANMERPRLL